MREIIKNNNHHVYFDNDDNDYIRTKSMKGTPVWFYRSKKIVNHSWNYADEVEMEQKYQMEKRKQKLKRILNGK